MITTKNLKEVLENLGFSSKGDLFTKKFESYDCFLKVDFKRKAIYYPEKKGFKINDKTTCNFSSKENFVVLECVNRLLEQGYNPAHLELEPKWKVGHGASGGKADILVKDNKGKSLLIIECKNAGTEFAKHWNETLENGSQLFGYAQQERDASFLCLYASDFIDGKVQPNYRLITLQDNEQYLEDNLKLESFKDAKVREDLHRVWKNTYQKDYTTKGLFEKDIQAYNIGKKKYTIDDLSLIDSTTKQSKHHAFATILRKYNVSGRENAFDKLVNLFLCKIVDEKNNPNDLQFYWKGIAYDTPFELQDRLQKLYQTGMNIFLKEDVTYIDNQQIDKAFWAFKNDPDATRETIKSYFRQLKFFTNNDFAFIDVHNERLFYENAEVLIDIVRLFQDTKITSSSKNQFLGDMFENFLDGGVKQSEGQFFTPMPITRFIIQSLPLEQMINESQQIPKAIDYACGSGHFLNELASQMRPFIEKNKEVSLEEYHKAIHGIEKEYRLSKVAKVSAFMYGQDNIDITYADALAKLDKFKANDYQILVANPPYSVKGFLGTLDQDSKESYELLNTLSSKQIPTNNSIECFFIERAKQMLGPNGVGAIIVPSSILSNGDSTYIETRSILLKYFDIISISEFGSGTFGKTGTNTVTLFLRRKGNEPEQAVHYQNRVNDWFSGDTKKQKVFDDQHFIESYCQHIDIDFEDYKTLLQGKPNSNLLKVEMFVEYLDAFNKLTSTKNKKKQSSFKKLSKGDKQKELDEMFFKYLTNIEKEKLYYYVIASQNTTDVVIVKAPSDNKANKNFLGYEWSSAKGSEGIKLYKDNNGKHLTPLYHEDDRNSENKINSIINNAFNNAPVAVKSELENFVSISPLVNMLNFTRTDFSRQISLNPSVELKINSKWELVKMENLMDIQRGASPRPINDYLTESADGINWIKIGDISPEDKYVTSTEQKITKEGALKSRFIKEGTFILSNSMSAGRPYILKIDGCVHDGWLILSEISSKLDKDYLYEILTSNEIQNILVGKAIGGVVKNLNTDRVKSLKIPIPTSNIQSKIVSECKKIDTEKDKAILSIQNAKDTIESSFKRASSIADKTFKLSSSSDFDAFIGRRVLKKEVDTPGANIPIFSANVFEPFGLIDKLFIKDFSEPSVLWGIDGDWMVNYIPANYKFYPTDHCGVIRIKTKEVNPRYLTWALNEAGKEKRFSRSHRASTDRIKGISIKVPDIKTQTELEKEIIKQEKIIEKAQKVIENIAERKQAVLDKYL
ncbi:N-6 DNA methylase [Flavivirga algicola]|uniref:N-6 DNA methylase n=1 Tax=Flavivirga algicola TaxID=2729136 RepID=A0ABX1RWV3_9FLAO|nr:N-6 DNA methylase [Flavivirga algicola]NMH88065.1 N-6 DNA methylase [Flavivirga algicola]